MKIFIASVFGKYTNGKYFVHRDLKWPAQKNKNRVLLKKLWKVITRFAHNFFYIVIKVVLVNIIPDFYERVNKHVSEIFTINWFSLAHNQFVAVADSEPVQQPPPLPPH